MAKINSKLFREIFSHRLRAFRLLAGYRTAREFSRDIEEEENTYSKWERGDNMPSIEQLVRICIELQVTPNDFVWDRTKKSDPKEAFTRLASMEFPEE